VLDNLITAISVRDFVAGLKPELVVGVVAVLLVGLIVAAVCVALVLRRRQLVSRSSTALHLLDDLNSQFQTLVAGHPPIRHEFKVSVNSKAKFDNFNLPSRMSVNVLENELWAGQQIELRLAATRHFTTYGRDYEFIEYGALGRSSHPRIRDDKFAVIERKQFTRRKLEYPTPMAQITTTVKYTSPKGQNSYSRHLNWDFERLQRGLQDARAVREGQSTTAALRQRERSLMTAGLRMTILRRDNFRCQMCGAAASDDTVLHIDHIIPVSRDGRTTPENLQTLCQSCNIGKSNKFIG
jgi:hypothetical protein